MRSFSYWKCVALLSCAHLIFLTLINVYLYHRRPVFFNRKSVNLTMLIWSFQHSLVINRLCISVLLSGLPRFIKSLYFAFCRFLKRLKFTRTSFSERIKYVMQMKVFLAARSWYNVYLFSAYFVLGEQLINGTFPFFTFLTTTALNVPHLSKSAVSDENFFVFIWL